VAAGAVLLYLNRNMQLENPLIDELNQWKITQGIEVTATASPTLLGVTATRTF
jgi:hypothetical protein